MDKTVVVFGAGTGLGSAVARRFGREGYRVALVARTSARLRDLAGTLAAEGISAEAFPADLTATAEIPALIDRIRARFGRIDAIEYAPITTDLFTPAAALTVAEARRYVDLYLLTPIAIVQAVLPGMLDRGDGVILLGQGISGVRPMPGLSGLGPAMAAARNYLHSLHGEVADRGVYAGMLHVAGVIVGSAGHRAMTAGELPIDLSHVPKLDPSDLADRMWTLAADRGRFEETVPGGR